MSCSICRPRCAITTSRVERAINSCMTRRCSAFGSRKTVCRVVTTGIRNSRSKRQQMAAGGSAENAELVLHTDNVCVADVEEVGGVAVGGQVLLLNFKANRVRVFVTALDVVHGHREALGCEGAQRRSRRASRT